MTTIATTRPLRTLTEGLNFFESSGGYPSQLADADTINVFEDFDRTELYGRRQRFLSAVQEAIRVYLKEKESDEADIDGSTLSEARDFACRIPTKLPVPEVFIDSSGSIAFDWTSAPHHSVVVEFNGIGKMSYAVLQGRSSSLHGVKVVSDEFPKEISDQIKECFGIDSI